MCVQCAHSTQYIARVFYLDVDNDFKELKTNTSNEHKFVSQLNSEIIIIITDTIF